jgi:hypothetical protein
MRLWRCARRFLSSVACDEGRKVKGLGGCRRTEMHAKRANTSPPNYNQTNAVWLSRMYSLQPLTHSSSVLTSIGLLMYLSLSLKVRCKTLNDADPFTS